MANFWHRKLKERVRKGMRREINTSCVGAKMRLRKEVRIGTAGLSSDVAWRLREMAHKGGAND